jgi:signal transduction histidine kinase/DNA-binding response OmpR family regulator
MADQASRDDQRPIALLVAATVVLIGAIVGANLFFLGHLRESLLLAVNQSEASALAEWRRMAALLAGISLGCCLLIMAAAFVIARWWRARERAARAALAANDAKSSFLAMMSHEIRTPMNAVLGLSATLLATQLSNDQRQSVVAIHNAGDNLLELLNDILDFSRLESGRVSLERIAFAPDSIADHTLSVMGPRAAAKDVLLRTTKETTLPPALTGDAGRIRQILLNLVSNAIKFTEAGEVTLSIRCLAQDDERATIEWSVRDTGIGIAPDRLVELFKDYVQADSSISRRFGGSGLGLSICKRLVEQMGGEIGVTSTPGKGSTFRFSLTLPVAAEAALAGKDDDAPLLAELQRHVVRLGRPLRVLIADDNATNRLVASKMLKEFSVLATMVCDGAEAVAAATRFDYDVILMDVRMPGMDGLQATRALRARGGRLATLPIIAFTANAFTDDMRACEEAGMNGFVAKPVRKKEMIAAIMRALASGAAAPPDAARPPAQESVPPEAPAFDRACYDTMVSELGDEAMRDLVEIFLAETEKRIALLKALTGALDRNTVEREAHSLKSDAAALGLVRLSGLARGLEKDAATIAEAEYRATLDGLAAAFADGRDTLRKPVETAAA